MENGFGGKLENQQRLALMLLWGLLHGRVDRNTAHRLQLFAANLA